MWSFEIYNDWKEIWSETFLMKWNHIYESSPFSHVFFHPAVARIWIDTYMPLRKITPIFVWGRYKDIEVFLPLVLWKKNWKQVFMKSIVSVGYSDYDYHDPLFSKMISDDEKEAFWVDLFESLKIYHADEVCLEGIRSDIISSDPNWIKGEICPCLNLSDLSDDSDLLSFLNTKLRGDIRRQIRRLNEIAELKFKEYNSIGEVPVELFEEFLKVHTLRWPHAYKAPLFHKNLLGLCGINGPVHFSTLSVGDVVVAWHLGFEDDSTYYYYMPAGNPEYQKYSPVKIHLYYLICRAIKKGLVKYDHLRGDETYKSGWADGSIYVNSLRQFNSSLSTNMKRSLLKFRSVIS